MLKKILVSTFLLLFCGGLIFLLSDKILSYGPEETHSPLTKQIAFFYNLNYDPDLTAEEIKQLMKGSIEEDTPYRWMNHFYDPVYNIGWEGNLSSKKWSQNSEIQNAYPNGDHSWQRAIYQYLKGDKLEAYKSLGHILHLIEDITVPAHTRNDTHALPNDKEPYEQWTGNLSKEYYNFAQPLYNQGIKPKALSNLGDYFDELARYTNRYFFSKDTVPEKSDEKVFSKYSVGPTIVRRDNQYCYGLDENQKEFRLAKIDVAGVCYIEPDAKKIFEPHLDYWNRLAPKTVIYGAGIINLFHQEVEKIKKSEKPAPEVYQVSKIEDILNNSKTLISSLSSLAFNGIKYAISQETKYFKEKITQGFITIKETFNETIESIQNTLSQLNPFKASLVETPAPQPEVKTPDREKTFEPFETKPAKEGEISEKEKEDLRKKELQEKIDSLLEEIDLVQAKIAKLGKEKVAEKEAEKISKELKKPEELEEKKKKKEKTLEKQKIEQILCERFTGVQPVRNKVIFNEIAWMGTTNSFNDEWIELKNISGKEIDLVGWQIQNKDQKIKIVLNGGLSSVNSLFLLERSNDDSVPGVKADLIYTGALKNENEALYLFNQNCQLQDEVLATPNWQAGDNSSKRTMERKSDLSWQTSLNPGGTPKAENSSGYFVPTTTSGAGGAGGSGSGAGAGAPAPAPEINLSYPQEIPVNKEIEVQLSVSNLKEATYDVKISIEAGTSTISEIFNEKINDWQTSYKYVTSTFSGTAFSGRFRLRIKDDNFRGEADIIAKIRQSDNKKVISEFKGKINITEPENQPPQAVFTFFPQNPFLEQEILLDASSSTDPDGQTVSFLWDFGDGNSTTTQATTSYSYATSGSFIINLYIQDEKGATSSTSTIIEILEPKTAENLIISEVFIIGKEEFVELYNPTEKDVDTTNWYLSYFSSGKNWNEPSYNKLFSQAPTTTLPAKSYFLIGFGNYNDSKMDWKADGRNLSDKAGSIGIFSCDPSASSTEAAIECKIDLFSWKKEDTTSPIVFEGNPFSFKPSELEGKSFQRKQNQVGFYLDNNDNSIDFEIASSTDCGLKGLPPNPVENFLVDSENSFGNQVVLTWSTSTDPDTFSENLTYKIYWSKEGEITENNLDATSTFSATTSATLITIFNLLYNSTYYFAIKAFDPQNNFSVLTTTTPYQTATLSTIATNVLSGSGIKNQGRKITRISNGNLYIVYSKNNKIFLGKSIDQGKSWSEIPASDNEEFEQIEPSIAVDNNDIIHLAWQGKISATSTFQIRYRKYIDNSFSPIENLTNTLEGSQTTPIVVIDSQDNVHLVWLGQDNLYHLSSLNNTWQAPKIVKNKESRYGNTSCISNFSLAIDSQDNLHLAWREVVPTGWGSSQSFFRYRKGKTGNWSEIRELDSNDVSFSSMVIDSNDNLHLVWQYDWRYCDPPDNAYYGYSLNYLKYNNSTDTWSDINSLVSQCGYQIYFPSLSLDFQDVIYLVSSDGREGRYEKIYQLKYETSWSQPRQLIEVEPITVLQKYPNSLWSFYPIIEGRKTNQPKQGYAFIFYEEGNLKFYASPDLTWE